MLSIRTDPVSSNFTAVSVRSGHSSYFLIREIAVSLNSKDVQIFSKAGNDWKATETLSEVRTV